MRIFFVLTILTSLFSLAAKANVACGGTCVVTGKRHHFTFDRIDSNTYREGMERCLRIPASYEIIPVSAGSSRYMACFSYINQSIALSVVDMDEWLARNELRKICEDKYRVGDDRGYDYTRAESRNVTCTQVNLTRGIYGIRR